MVGCSLHLACALMMLAWCHDILQVFSQCLCDCLLGLYDLWHEVWLVKGKGWQANMEARCKTRTILDGFAEEYNSFMMKMYGTMISLSIYDVETLLYSLEAQLDKIRKELAVVIFSANVAHANHQTCGIHNQHTNSRGRSYISCSKRCGRGRTMPGT
ncbi:hypothetical protein KIW84_033350 [Lathyrus oleraceus]|uniref:Uncharacterized protein n=1 Tax=Pisum sativum TaxID=3888 RepID=A0A9D4XVQ8_PEA|nr:hypothetical protein KIW84_033350 [Pisum sativum]